MRIATKTVYSMAKYHLGAIAEEMYKDNEAIASGKRIIRPSDDPVGMTQSLQIRSSLSSITQFQSTISLGTSWLNLAERTRPRISTEYFLRRSWPSMVNGRLAKLTRAWYMAGLNAWRAKAMPAAILPFIVIVFTLSLPGVLMRSRTCCQITRRVG